MAAKLKSIYALKSLIYLFTVKSYTRYTENTCEYLRMLTGKGFLLNCVRKWRNMRWYEHDQMDVWAYVEREEENAELRELLWLEPVSLVTKKGRLDRYRDGDSLDILNIKMMLIRWSIRWRRTQIELDTGDILGRHGSMMSRIWKVMVCPESMHRFRTNGGGKSRGNQITQVHLKNGH